VLSESASPDGKRIPGETGSEAMMEEGKELQKTFPMDEMDRALIGLSGVKEDKILAEWGKTSLLQAIEDIQSLESCVPLLEKEKGLQVRRSIDYLKEFLTIYAGTPSAFLPRSFNKQKEAPIGRNEFEKWFFDHLRANYVGHHVKMGDIEGIISRFGWDVVEIRSVLESNGIMMMGEWRLEGEWGTHFTCFIELLDGEMNAVMYFPGEMAPKIIKALGESE